MSLDDAALYTKRGIVYFLLFVLVYITGENIFRFYLYAYGRVFPDPPPPPQFAYGKIEPLNIRTLPLDVSNIDVRQELSTPFLPQFSTKMRVYSIEQPRTSVIKEERFSNAAEILGFGRRGIKLSETERLWVADGAQRQFKAEVFYETFTYTTRNEFLEEILSQGNSPSPEESVEATQNFFSQVGMWNDDLRNAEYLTESAYIEEGLVREAETSFRETLKFVAVFPKKIAYTTTELNDQNQLEEVDVYKKIFFSNPVIPNVNTYVANLPDNSSNRNGLVVTNATHTYYNTTQEYSEYPIISTQQAWENLVSGGASLVYIKKDGSDFFAPNESIENIDIIDIREIDIGYYMPIEQPEHLKPIYIYKGKFTTAEKETGNLIFYADALDPQGLL